MMASSAHTARVLCVVGVLYAMCGIVSARTAATSSIRGLRSNALSPASASRAELAVGCPKRVTPGDKKDFFIAAVSGVCTSFRVKVDHDAHIGLFEDGEDKGKMYEVVIGTSGNALSSIRYGFGGKNIVVERTPQRLSDQKGRWFWVCWANHNVQVGQGRVAGASAFMSHHFRGRRLSISKVGISSGWGDTGYWRFPCKPTAQALNLVSNGGFEKFSARGSGKNWMYTQEGGEGSTDKRAIRDWKQEGKTAGLTTTCPEWMPQGPAEGNQAAILQGNVKVSQRIKVKAGHPHTLTFAYARRWGHRNKNINYNAPSKLTVTADDQKLFHRSMGESFLDFHWQRQTVTFVPKNNVVVVAFSSDSSGSDRTVLLDDVQLVNGEFSTVDVWSGGFKAPSWSSFQVNNERKMSSTHRGINLLVVDSKGSLLKQATFDTYGSSGAAKSLALTLEKVKDNEFVAISVKDEASNQLGAAHGPLRKFGVNLDRIRRFRAAYLYVGSRDTGALVERTGPDNMVISGTAFVPGSLASHLANHKKHSELLNSWQEKHEERKAKLTTATKHLQNKKDAHTRAQNDARTAKKDHENAATAAGQAKEDLKAADTQHSDASQRLSQAKITLQKQKDELQAAKEAVIAAENKLNSLTRDLKIKGTALNDAQSALASAKASHRAARSKLNLVLSQQGSEKRAAVLSSRSKMDALAVALEKAKAATAEAKGHLVKAVTDSQEAVNKKKAAIEDVNKATTRHMEMDSTKARAQLEESRATAAESAAEGRLDSAKSALSTKQSSLREALKVQTRARERHEDAMRTLEALKAKFESRHGGVVTAVNARDKAGQKLQSEQGLLAKQEQKVADANTVLDKASTAVQSATDAVKQAEADQQAALASYTAAAKAQAEAEVAAQSALSARDEAIARHKEAESNVLKAKAALQQATADHESKQQAEATAQQVVDKAAQAQQVAEKAEAVSQTAHDKIAQKTAHAKEWMDSHHKRKEHYYKEYKKRIAPYVDAKAAQGSWDVSGK